MGFTLPSPTENLFRLERLLLLDGVSTAAALRARLGISGPTLSRLVASAEGRVLRLGRARAARYALPRPLPELPPRLPVYRIDSKGTAALAGHLAPLAGGGTWVEPVGGPGHLHVGLPPFIVDMAPSGYLGRRFSDRNADLHLPPRLQDWSDDHRLIAVARRGDDSSGDLAIGDESMDRLLAASPQEARDADYPRLAEISAAGGAGSSAAGEHPKFAAVRHGVHVLVKFTAGDRSPSDLRWRDLLVCEALALEHLRQAGIPSSAARVVDVGERRFLEVHRFDRVGLRGRRGLLSLGPLDDDLFGGRDSWTAAAGRLETARLLSSSDARRLRLLDAFGAAIANGDRHFGNVSFFADGLSEKPRLELAPVYDMLPMDAAPRAGLIPTLPAAPPKPRTAWLDVWEQAIELASAYWLRVAKDRRISRELRESAAGLVRLS